MDRLQLPKMPFVARDAAVEASGAGSSPGGLARLRQRLRGGRLPFLAGLLALLILVDAGVAVYDAREATFNTLYVAAVGKVRMLSHRLAKAAQQASQGNAVAFKQLRDSRDEFAAVVKLLGAGGVASGVTLPPTPERVRPLLGTLETQWRKTERNAGLVIAEERNLVALGAAVRAINDNNPALLELADEIAALSVQSGSSARQNAITAHLVMLTQRMAKNANAMLAGDVVDPEVAFLLGKAFVDESRGRAEQSEHQNRANEAAILRLLDEIGNLASGDLTVRAKVTEHMTGAIADSINYTIDELRRLVAGINTAAQQVTAATQEAQTVSTQLLHAAQKQASEIQNTGQSVAQMAQSMNQVSSNADDSAKVAETSLNAASKGAQAVQNAIRGMNDIRDQIQETSKRIKRLGESSQEIGEIVQLISDITEQTNVLALNAAIQAASAGEAGRGFTVVAEEVQRLAERSAEATKHIGAIVKSIQRDTQDAVDAMERSTRGVVEGTATADEADQALREIDQVSSRLAELIGSISGATQQQAVSAAQVAGKMKIILGITQLTTEGTKKTAASAARLTALAEGLRSSVAGFKVG